MFASLLALVTSATVDLNANARAEGNRKADAVALGRVLLRTVWPAQVLKIRIDGAGRHEVAGILVSGVQFHTPLDPTAFSDEIAELVRSTLRNSPVEEVDVWATVPLPPFAQKPVNGEFLQPTDRVVYGVAVTRSEQNTLADRLRDRRDVFWDAAWKATLGDR